jgi:hypothetical protein
MGGGLGRIIGDEVGVGVGVGVGVAFLTWPGALFDGLGSAAVLVTALAEALALKAAATLLLVLAERLVVTLSTMSTEARATRVKMNDVRARPAR